jgi:DNA adenine methylase
MQVYREVKRRPAQVVEQLKHLATRGTTRKAYLAVRDDSNVDLPGPALAARFIYLNRFCFNGLYRTNARGGFNVPYGGEKSGRLPPPEIIFGCSEKLRGAVLVSGDFERVLSLARAGDFVYMDPPFSVAARRIFREYHQSSFCSEDLARLRDWMERLATKGISFLVSYAESEEAGFLKRGFRTSTVTVRRNIAGFAGARTCSREVLIYPE